MRHPTYEKLSRGFAVTALALLGFACAEDALVGGSCREGLTECGLKCVDLQRDPANCGTCGHACAAGQTCSAGTCGPGGAVDASGDGQGRPDVDAGDVIVADRAMGDAMRPDVSAPDSTAPDSAAPDGLLPDSTAPDGATPDGPTCLPPFDTPEHCGDCSTRCLDPTPLCGLQGGTFKCVARCDPPLVVCGANCVNTSSDEKNCGTCGLVCPSGICQAGSCVGKGYGHEVVIGTDYSDSTLSDSSAQVTMLGNAVFQSVAPAVRILAYEEFADSDTIARIEGWLLPIATSRGKSVTISKAIDWTVIPSELAVTQYQVFLVYDQARAPAGQMATTGSFWNATMNAFAKGGGIIVALDGGSVGRMRDLLTNSGLLAVTAETDITGTQLNVDAPTDVVGQNLPNVFASRKTTIAFTTTQVRDNYHVFVVTDSTGMLPVVVHSVPRP